MSLWKRGNKYWADFTVDGKRYRVPLKTADRRRAIQAEKDLIAEALEGKLPTGQRAAFARMEFNEACDRYLSERELQAAYPRKERSLAVQLRRFFRGKRLNQITGEAVWAYQAQRLGEGKSPKTINHEVKLLFQMLKRAKLLARIRDDVKLLAVPRRIRRMLTEEEKWNLFRTAASKPEWQGAYCAAILTVNTSMRPSELKRLRWADIDSADGIVLVRRSKTEAGLRVIPLNAEARSAVTALEKRARCLGTFNADCYVFPRLWPCTDGTQPMGQNLWRSAWRSLRKAAGMPWLRFYDLRHQFITELAEHGTPEAIIRDLAGHADPSMMRVYAHPRMLARRLAVEGLSSAKPEQESEGRVTDSVTKSLSGSSRPM